MTKFSIIKGILVVSILLTFIGCGAKDANNSSEASDSTTVVLSDEVLAAIDDLNAVQLNYSNGTAPLNIIPFVTVETIYNSWDDIVSSGNAKAPIMLREYVDPAAVYLDYDTDYSIIWYKDSGDVVVEPTDVTAREEFKQKQHK